MPCIWPSKPKPKPKPNRPKPKPKPGPKQAADLDFEISEHEMARLSGLARGLGQL